jgi:DNA-binding CsgD family transcriptional regulator
LGFSLGFIGSIGFYYLFYKLNKPVSRWRSAVLLAVAVLGFPLCMLYQDIFYFKLPAEISLIDLNVLIIALFLLACVILGNNRLRALISASFIFSIIHLTQIPVVNFNLAFISLVTDMSSFNMETLLQSPEMWYSRFIFVIIIIITVCCLLVTRWLSESKVKPPLKLYISFNLLFVLFTLIALMWFEDFLKAMSLSFLTSAFMGTLFIVVMLFLFYLYTRLTKENLTRGIHEKRNQLLLAAVNNDKYKQYIPLLSRRELEVIEAVLAGNVRYKQLSAALDISVSTVKTHLKNIYQTTGVSNIAALISLFHNFTPIHPKFTQKSSINNP